MSLPNTSLRGLLTCCLIALSPAFGQIGAKSAIRGAIDVGRVPRDIRLSQITAVLKRSPEQQKDLDAFLRDLQNPASPNFRRWLSPEEFSSRFSASSGTIDEICAWLKEEGFTIKTVARGRGWVVFEGTASDAERAFQTELHRYRTGTIEHFAPAAEPQIPLQFAGSVAGVRGLDDVYPEPPRRPSPSFLAGDGNHYLSPGDVERIYDFPGLSGQGQTVAIVGESRIDVSDIDLFYSTLGIPPNDPKLVLAGNDPGTNADALFEADADIEWVGSLASQASILYAYATNVFDAAQTVIDQNLATILLFTYGVCEANLSASDATFLRGMAQQASAQGITWIASSGDSGAAGCDSHASMASNGLVVMVPASLPEVTAVGGTEFTEKPDAWASNGAATTYFSETGWNDTAALSSLSASGGGVSTLFETPAWQNGSTFNPKGRNVPDVAFSASPVHDGYIVVSGGQGYSAGGTSLAAPVFASIVARAGQKLENLSGMNGLGNINSSIYATQALQGPNSVIFHDIISGNNVVPCAEGSPDCIGGSLGYQAGPGYDLVTGLGSVDAQGFITSFGLATTASVTFSPSQVQEAGSISFTANVRAFNGDIPSGSIAIFWNQPGLNPFGVASAVLDASGNAKGTLTLSPGSYSLTAYFSGSSRYQQSVSSPVNVVVNPFPPQPPTAPAPVDKSTSVSVGVQLTWAESEGTATFDVYLGTTSPPPFWGNVSYPQCFPSGLAANTTYYWRIVAKNATGTATSPIWSFRTASAPVYSISILAGTGTFGFSGDDGPASQAKLWGALDVALDPAGNVYVADSGNQRVRVITPDGAIKTVAGGGTFTGAGANGQPGRLAQIVPLGIATDRSGNVYISSNDSTVRMLTPDGNIATIAGNWTSGYSGDGGPAVQAQLNSPGAIAVDLSGSLYIADRGNNCIRKVSSGVISTVAGICGTRPVAGPLGGSATAAVLDGPTGVAVDPSGNIFLSDSQGIKEISKGLLSLVAQSSCCAARLAFDPSGTLYSSGGQVAKVVGGTFIPIGGTPAFTTHTPATSVVATDVQLNAGGIAVDSKGEVYVANADNGFPVSYVLVLDPLSEPPAARITTGGIVNAASYVTGPLAPGSIASIYGNFTLNAPAQPAGAPLPVALSGLSIEIGGIPAPLFYASANLVNVQIPWELAGLSAVPVKALLNGSSGAAASIAIGSASPGIFTVGGAQGAIVNTAGTLANSLSPVTAGEAIVIYCTGLGPVTNPPATGAAASVAGLSRTLAVPVVTIGGVNANILFSGLAPGSVGEYQINVQVPPGVTPGSAVPVVISIGGVESNAATIATR